MEFQAESPSITRLQLSILACLPLTGDEHSRFKVTGDARYEHASRRPTSGSIEIDGRK